jgi:hypothetical protein
MAIIDYAVLDTDGIRMDLMIENEVRSLLHDGASIRNSGALIFAGDIAGMGSDTIALRYSSLDGYTPMGAQADGTELTSSNLTNVTANIAVARQGLRYDLTDLASLSGFGSDIDVFRLAESMRGAFESRFMTLLCATFAGVTAQAGTTGVALSVDDFMDSIYALELANNPGDLACVLAPRQVADLQASIRNETGNAIAFNPAQSEILKMVGQGFIGSFMGVDIHKSSKCAEVGADVIGAMWSRGAFGYALGTPQPLAVGGVIRPAGTPVMVELQRDASLSLTEVVGTAYVGCALVEDARACEILSKKA